MDKFLKKDILSKGIFGALIEISSLILIYFFRRDISKISETFFTTLMMVIPLLILGIFIKQSIIEIKNHNKNHSEFELFSTGYLTGSIIVINTVIAFTLGLIVFEIKTGLSNNPKLILNEVLTTGSVLFGVGILSSLIISYLFHCIISHSKHSKNLNMRKSFRRLTSHKK
jgi:magnesium-transporting ATPase (P-type)